ncbi:MAG: HAD family hydrolase [Blautia sp.]
MLNNKKAVLFDLDGTLVDSMWLWTAVDEEYFAEKGIAVSEIESFQKELEGMGFTDTAVFFREKFGIQDSVETIKKRWVELAQDKYCNEVPLKEGVREFLIYLKERGIPTAICSSNSIQLIQMVLEAHGVKQYFTHMITCCDVSASKPAPDVYLAAALALQVSPEDCLVFEDVPMGILAGKNAGMRVCAVEDPYSVTQREEKKKLADYYIDNYYQILDHTYEVLS